MKELAAMSLKELREVEIEVRRLMSNSNSMKFA